MLTVFPVISPAESPLKRLSKFLIYAIIILLAALVGFRDFSVGTDTAVYNAIYSDSQLCNCFPPGIEPLFGLFTWFVGWLELSTPIFFALISFIQMILAFKLGILIAHIANYQDKEKIFCVLFLSFTLASPFFFNGQVNLLRQGISAPLVVLSLLLLSLRKYFPALIIASIAVALHYSASLFFVAAPLLFIKRRSIYFISVLLISAYTAGVSEFAVQWASNLAGLPIYAFFQDYGSEADYDRGVRYDFLIFSYMPLIAMHGFNWLFRSSADRSGLILLEKVYLILLFPFLVFGWGAFSDRYVFDAWLLLAAIPSIILSRLLPYRHPALASVFLAVGILLFLFYLSSSNG